VGLRVGSRRVPEFGIDAVRRDTVDDGVDEGVGVGGGVMVDVVEMVLLVDTLPASVFVNASVADDVASADVEMLEVGVAVIDGPVVFESDAETLGTGDAVTMELEKSTVMVLLLVVLMVTSAEELGLGRIVAVDVMNPLSDCDVLAVTVSVRDPICETDPYVSDTEVVASTVNDARLLDTDTDTVSLFD
jgi:hypothetical protein